MNKKAFTLIELLAVIILIGLIAVITIPKINDSLESSRKNLAKTSALNYTKTIDEKILHEKINKERINLNGEYNINENGNIYNTTDEYELEYTGTKPKSGTLTYINNELQSGCITINKYKVTFQNGEVINTVKGNCVQEQQEVISQKVNTYVKAALTANSSLTYETAKTVSEMSGVTTNTPNSGWIHFNIDNDTVVITDYSLTYGDITANYQSFIDNNYISTFGEARKKPIIVGSPVCYGPTGQQECFKIIKIFTQEGTQKAMLFADYKLKKDTTTNPVTYKQDASSRDTITFSDSIYWMDETTTPNTLKSAYSNNGAYSYDSTNNKFVDTNNTQVSPNIYDSNSNTHGYVEGYLETLKTSTYGLPSSATGRLLYYDEANDTTMFANSVARENGKSYWLGSASYSNYVRAVGPSGNFESSPSYNNARYGVRPVIIIPTSDL